MGLYQNKNNIIPYNFHGPWNKADRFLGKL